MKKKVWFDFVYKFDANGKLKRRFPGFKIRHWFYINIYKRKELKRLMKGRSKSIIWIFLLN
jgi:hypothetical protein